MFEPHRRSADGNPAVPLAPAHERARGNDTRAMALAVKDYLERKVAGIMLPPADAACLAIKTDRFSVFVDGRCVDSDKRGACYQHETDEVRRTSQSLGNVCRRPIQFDKVCNAGLLGWSRTPTTLVAGASIPLPPNIDCEFHRTGK